MNKMSQCPALLLTLLVIAYIGSPSLFGFGKVGTGTEHFKNQIVMESQQTKNFGDGKGQPLAESKSCSIHPTALAGNRMAVKMVKRLIPQTEKRVQNEPIRYNLILYPKDHQQSTNQGQRGYQIRERYFATHLRNSSQSQALSPPRFPIISASRFTSKVPQSFPVASTVLTPHEKKSPTIFLWNFGSIQGQGQISSSKRPSWFSIHPRKPSNFHHIPDIKPHNFSSQLMTVAVPTYQSLPLPFAPSTTFKPQEVYPTYSAIPLVNNTFIQTLSPPIAVTFITHPPQPAFVKLYDVENQPLQPQLYFTPNTTRVYLIQTLPPLENNPTEMKFRTIWSNKLQMGATKAVVKPTQPMVTVNLPFVCSAQSMVIQVQPSVSKAQCPYLQNENHFTSYLQNGSVNKTLLQTITMRTTDDKKSINTGFHPYSFCTFEPIKNASFQEPDILLFSDNLSLTFSQLPATTSFHQEPTTHHLKEYPKPERFFFDLKLPRH